MGSVDRRCVGLSVLEVSGSVFCNTGAVVQLMSSLPGRSTGNRAARVSKGASIRTWGGCKDPPKGRSKEVRFMVVTDGAAGEGAGDILC